MREVFHTGAFRRDIKRESRGRYASTLEADLLPVVEALANDEPLAPRHCDHALIGTWRGCRDCHVRPDLVLIYRKPVAKTLELLRLGSHSDLRL